MIKTFMVGLMVLCMVGSSHAASIATSNPNSSSFYRVSIDPQYFNYDYDFVSVNSSSAVNVQTSDFWTDSNQLWIIGSDNIGSLHTFDLTPMPTSIAIDLQQINGSQQSYDYRYYYGNTTNVPVQTVWLPIQLQSLVGVPEPTTLGIAGMALIGLGLLSRRR